MIHFEERKVPPFICLPNAKDVLMRGLRHFIGGIPEWLPEYDDIVEWLSGNDGKGLLCVGDYGRGKTLICEKILPAVFMSLSYKVTFLSAYALRRDYDKIYDTQVLIVDDFGVEDTSVVYGERRNLFGEIVDYAERNSVLLILTSNLTAEMITEKYGVRIADRLKRLTRAVMFSGDSLRGYTPAQPAYAYGIAFDTNEEADEFALEQEKIRSGYQAGKYKVCNSRVEDHMSAGDPVRLVDGVVYDYYG